MTLYHPEDILRFLNMDETQHPISTEVRKGAFKYHSPILTRTGDRVVDSSRHITGCYTTNPWEVIPPIYIFDSKAASSDNFKVKPSWVNSGHPPLKRGCRNSIPEILLKGFIMHATGIQCSGDTGETEMASMVSSIGGFVHDTAFEVTFIYDYCWMQVRNIYPESMVPTKFFDHEDRWRKWLT